MADFTIKKGMLRPKLEVTLKGAGGTAIDLGAANTVDLRMRPKGTSGVAALSTVASIATAAGGGVEYQWVAGNTDTVGEYDAEFIIHWNTGLSEAVPNDKGDPYLNIEILEALD